MANYKGTLKKTGFCRKVIGSAIMAGCLIISAGSYAKETSAPLGATLQQLSEQYPVNWISVQTIADELKGRGPISVGFDIDDTLLYSSPAFFYGQMKFSPGSRDYLKNPAFWNEVSSAGWDKFSVPKTSGKALISLHLERGDNIFFITRRPLPTSGKEDLTAILGADFNIPAARLNKVIFTGRGKDAKVKFIKDNHIAIFYGDSDNDILDARKAGAEGIRVLRPLNSTNRPLPVNGRFGERVIINSQY